MGLVQSILSKDNSLSESSGRSEQQSLQDSEPAAGVTSTSARSQSPSSHSPSSPRSASPRKSPKRSTDKIERIVVSPTNSDIYDYQQALSSLHSSKNKSKTVSISKDPEVVSADAFTQFRSTLALGQLITAKTPSAGSKMIAQELQTLSSTLKQESAALRKEISSLPESVANSLKSVLDDERDQRNALAVDRRPVFGRFPYRRFPVRRRAPRIALQFARKSVSNASTNTSPPRSPPTSTTPAPASKSVSNSGSNQDQSESSRRLARKSAPLAMKSPVAAKTAVSAQDLTANSTQQAQKQAQKGAQIQKQPQQQTQQPQQAQPQPQQQQAKQPFFAVKMIIPPNTLGPVLPNGTIFENTWFPPDNSSSSYDGEPDSDSDDSQSS